MTDEEYEIFQEKIKSGEIEEVPYPCGTTSFYDSDSNSYYNRARQRLRDPEEYDRHSEGYTPFGDEGY